MTNQEGRHSGCGRVLKLADAWISAVLSVRFGLEAIGVDFDALRHWIATIRRDSPHEARRLIEQRSSITVPVEGLESPGEIVTPVISSSRSLGGRFLNAVKTATIEQKFLAILLVLFLAKGVIISFVHAPYSGHDEVAHYAYLQMVAEDHRIPVLPELTEWREIHETENVYSHDRIPADFWKYCTRTTRDWDPGCRGENPQPSAIYAMTLGGEYYPTGWIYTANHPPLYYMVMTPLYWLTDGQSIETQLYVLRLAAIPFGLLTVLFAYLTVRTLFPRDRFLAMMVPAFVAFQPQIAYEAAMLNNDILAIAFTSAVIYLLALGLKTRFPIRTVILIGFCYGLAVLSKNTALTTGAIVAFAMILGLGVRNWREWVPKGALALAVTSLMIWPWYVYMYRTYGDFTGLARIRQLQYWNYGSNQRPTIWDQLSNRGFAWMRWRETWGEFGWRLIPLNPDLLRFILWVVLIGTIGIAVWAIRLYRVNHAILAAGNEQEAAEITARSESIFVLERWQVVGVLTMGVTCILAYFAVLQFGTTFSLTQARYYFPAIVPATVLLMLGYRAIIPRQWLNQAQLVMFASLVILTVVIYSAYVVPYWASAEKVYRDVNPFYR
jgi:4-amino-4-deoxy-L-arabinose transferase-like glycosyltransferase